MTNLQLSVHFFFQVTVILVVCRLVGVLGRRIGQPQVVAEMVAGVLLGPSLLGLIWPEGLARLFPTETMRVLYPVAQLGLAGYMFVVGLEFRLDLVRQSARSALAVAVAGMAAPIACGAALGWYFHRHTTLFPAKTTLAEAALFVAAALCITAFPMLARIIQHKNLGATTMGVVSLGAGAINDAAAWCLLTGVVASVDGDAWRIVASAGGGVGYVAVVVLVVRPWLTRWAEPIELRGRLNVGEFLLCLALLAAGAWCTDRAGLHAVFGAFVMGAAMPRGIVSAGLATRIQPLTATLLLPLFFAYSGLNTQLGTLGTANLWAMTALALAVAIGAKGVACWLAARATGVPHREALGIGTLMNVRGLMELIVLNIGLERGLITPKLFTVLAIMALVTTLMASPIFDLLVGRPRPATDSARP
ncbi:MAG: cation:proton antiporter [Opitutus sp.]|nr:cation:proton antiporter [Opitutus sp.]